MKKTTYTPYSADNDEIDFGQQLRVIWTNKYKILAALLAGGILGAAFLSGFIGRKELVGGLSRRE